MRFKAKDIIFDDDVDIIDDVVYGYLWATDKLVELSGCKIDIDSDDYIDFSSCYDVSKDKWYVEATGTINDKDFSRELNLTEDELNYIADKMIEYYFEDKEEWDDYISEIANE